MSANPTSDLGQITADDPRVAQVLALIRAKFGQINPIASAPSTETIAPQPLPQAPVAPQVMPPGAPTPSALPPMQGNVPQMPAAPQPEVTQGPGPVKSFLQHLVGGLGQATYAGSQSALQKLGMPTDYEKQQNAAKLAIAQQAANDTSAYRKSLTDLTQGKSAQLDQLTAPYAIAPNDQSVLPQFRGQSTTFGGYQALQKLSGQTQGKTDVANIGATARTDVAQTNASSRERLAEAQLGVRQAIADRNYGLAAQRLKMAGSNLGLRQLEYRMRAYGTGADGQPLPGVEFSADGIPVGTATQANIRPTANARNASERADTMQDLATRIRGALNDPEIRAGLGPVSGRINDVKGHAGVLDGPLAELRNDLVSYGAFQAGLHPVRGIGGLQYFDKVMGGLGQTPEELLGKLSSNDATSRSVQQVGRGTTAPSTSSPSSNGGHPSFFHPIK